MFFVRSFFKRQHFDIIGRKRREKVCGPCRRSVRATAPNTQAQRGTAGREGGPAQCQALSSSLSSARCRHSVNVCGVNE